MLQDYFMVMLHCQPEIYRWCIFGEGFAGYSQSQSVNYTKVGSNLYNQFIKSLEFLQEPSTLVAGRNIGKATGYYGWSNL
jgi:hypothetical protein